MSEGYKSIVERSGYQVVNACQAFTIFVFGLTAAVHPSIYHYQSLLFELESLIYYAHAY
jgi:hypothetical protein